MLYFAYRAWVEVGVLEQGGALVVSLACLRIDALRDAGAVMTAACVGAFGLLSNHCPLESGGQVSRPGKYRVCVEFLPPVLADGYFFVTAAGSTGLDAVQWVVDASGDNGTTWQTIGASVSRLFSDGSYFFNPALPYPTTQKRNTLVQFSLGPSVPWIFWLINSVVSSLGFACCLATAVAGRSRLVKKVWIGFLIAELATMAVAALGYQQDGDLRAAIACWVEFIQQLGLVFGLAFYEAHIIPFFLAFGVAYAVSIVVVDVVLYGAPVQLAAIAGSAGTIALLFALAILILRRRELYKSRRVVLADQALYDQLWDSLCKEPDASQMLANLAKEADLLIPVCPSKEPRQMCRGIPVAFDAEPTSGTRVGSGDREYSEYWDRAPLGTLPISKSRVNAATEKIQKLLLGLAVSSDRGGTGSISRLRDDEGSSISNYPSDSASQAVRQPLNNLSQPSEAAVGRESSELCWPLCNLEQLFVQASCLHPMLIAKVCHTLLYIKMMAYSVCYCFLLLNLYSALIHSLIVYCFRTTVKTRHHQLDRNRFLVDCFPAGAGMGTFVGWLRSVGGGK